MSKIGRFIRKEIRALLPPTIFFFVSFHILALFRSLLLRQHGIEVSALEGATFAALVVAKVVLIADKIPMINRFPDKPLIYNVVWKTLIYVVAALLVHHLEHLIPAWRRAGSYAGAMRLLKSEIVWANFWAIQLWLLVLFFVYSSLRELIRAIGPDEMKRLFFGIVPKARAVSSEV